ncbi:MAG: sugar transferase [Lachnospiraceae bacterium]|nr:sugar transferase [Lachnospiraceae bacterium]
MYKRYRQEWTKHLDFVIVEELSLQIAYLLAMWIRFRQILYPESIYKELAIVLFLIDFVVVMSLNTMHNVLKRGYFLELVETFKNCTAVFGFAVVYMYAMKVSEDYSRILLFVTFILHIVISYITRILWKIILAHTKINDSKKCSMIAVVDPDLADDTIGQLAAGGGDTYKLSGIVFTRKDKRKEINGIPVVCDIEEASSYICREWIDAVFVGVDKVTPRIDRFMEDCEQMTIPMHFAVSGVRHMGSHPFGNRVGGIMVLTAAARYASPLEHAIKRGVDIIGGLVGSLIALIIIAVVSPMIKHRSPGPVIYSQVRVGRNGKKFSMYNIRTMHTNADEIKEELMEQNRNKDGMMFKLDFDPRIIGNEVDADGTTHKGIGDFLRRRSLDEFPQFFNVLLGQMSLVGTRPPTEDEWEKYKFHHRARLVCKPGLTGLWQTSGRSSITDFEQVVELDTKYITEWSMSMDIRLIFKTLWMVIRGDECAM